MLRTWRKRSAGLCLGGALMVLLNAPAFAAWMNSELLLHDTRADAQRALWRAQAVEQLAGLGLAREAAGALVDAVFASGLVSGVPGGGLEVNADAVAGMLQGFGCSGDEARSLVSWLSPAELRWLEEQGAHAFAHAGKVVGVNYTGLLVLLLPILVAVIVASVAGQSAAGLALGALAVGVLFVLLVEPKFLFGERAEPGD